MNHEPIELGIKDVEEMVGKKAAHVVIRARDIVLYFCGGLTENGGLAATLEWRIKRW